MQKDGVRSANNEDKQLVERRKKFAEELYKKYYGKQGAGENTEALRRCNQA